MRVIDPQEQDSGEDIIQDAMIEHEAMKTLKVWTTGQPIPEWLWKPAYWEPEA